LENIASGFAVEKSFPLSGVALGLLVPLGLVAWGIAFVTLALRNGPMERPARVAQLYGYTVCLVSLVTILFTVPSVIDNIFRLADPLQAERGFDPALSSFDAYKATYERNRFPSRDENTGTRPTPSDEELRHQYEALRADRIAGNRFGARRSLVSEFLMLGLAAGLFLGHWRWLRRRDVEAAAA